MSQILENARSFQADWQERIALAITATIGVALSTGLIAALIYFMVALGSLTASPAAQAQAAPPSSGVRLQAGIEKENVDGDLRAAMRIYEKIASDPSAPRDVRARALLRLAGCEEKLGKQAKQVYEQIVRDYADLPVAAQARIRLAAIKQQEHPAPPTTMTVRKIDWARLGRVDAWDTDGERAVYLAPDGILYFGDLAGHNRRMVYKPQPGEGFSWQPSLDFSMVALSFDAKPNRPFTLAVVNSDGTGYRELIRDDQEGSIFGGNNCLYWSWDARYLIFSVDSGKTASHLSIVSLADGKPRELARVESGNIKEEAFSPDGRLVAYEVWPNDGQGGTARIFVVPAQGGPSRLVYESSPFQAQNAYHSLKDWTIDGHYLILKDIQQGKSGLYLLPMKDGGRTGAPAFVRFGDFDNAFTTSSGALVYQDEDSTQYSLHVSLATLDQDGHLGDWRNLELRGDFRPGVNPMASFSPDGSQIAYTAPTADPTRRDVIVRDLSSGQEHVVYQATSRFLACQYSSKNPKLFCTVEKENGRTDLISLAVESSAVEQIASFGAPRLIMQSPLEDETFYFVTKTYWADNSPIVRWDRATQKETDVVAPSDNIPPEEWLSPDGRSLVGQLEENLSTRAVSGGEWRILASNAGPGFMPGVTPDGAWVVYMASDPAGKRSLFRVSTAGGTPQRLGDPPSAAFWGNFVYSPDGRQILAVNNGSRKHDLWVLENFEPAVKK